MLPTSTSCATAFERFDLLDDRVRFLQGPLGRHARRTRRIEQRRAAAHRRAASGDARRRSSTRCTTGSRVGGFVVVDGYVEPPCAEVGRRRSAPRRGVDEPDRARRRRRRRVAQDRTTVDGPAPVERRRPPAADRAPRRPSPSRAARTAVDLSVVVVFYNMRREAARTLHSLSRAYQQGIDDLDYEVIVVENGSAPDQRLGEEFVRELRARVPLRRPRRRRHAVAGRPRSTAGSPRPSGDAIALMIDGAHVLTPGVLRFGMAGCATLRAGASSPPSSGTSGPASRATMLPSGYDQDYEDRLFDEIDWPTDGYRLFEIGHFIGDRDWFDGVWESNCIFVPARAARAGRRLRRELRRCPAAATPTSTSTSGSASSPDVTVVTILGEGSFHQVHGGTPRTSADADERAPRDRAYGEHYGELRGRQFRGPGKPIHYVGSMQSGAPDARPAAGRPGVPRGRERTGRRRARRSRCPIPEDFAFDFIDAFWRSLAWRDTTWLGTPLAQGADRPRRLPGDGRAGPARLDHRDRDRRRRAGPVPRAICELLGHGQVVSIDPHDDPDRPQHPRITYLRGAGVREADGRGGPRDHAATNRTASSIVGSAASRQQTAKEIAAYVQASSRSARTSSSRTPS